MSNGRTIISMVGLATALLVSGRAFAQGTGNDKCVSLMNNDARKVLDVATKADRSCVRKTAGGNATACVNGADATTNAKKTKLNSHYSSQCAGSLPAFGLSSGGPASISGAAEGAANAITHDLFGPTVAVGSGDVLRCQEKITQRAGQLAVTQWREFRNCKRANLSNFASGAALAAGCLGGPNGPQPDPGGKIAKRATKLSTDTQRRCVDSGVDPGTVLPGGCAGVAAGSFAQCVASRVRCRVCEGLQTADALSVSDINCDRVDDGVSNVSCGPGPTPTLTSTRSATITRTPTITPTPTVTLTRTPTATLPAFCQPLAELPPIAQVPVSIVEGAPHCGGPGLTPPPTPPLSGETLDGSATKIGDLGLGCLYAGGLPPVKLADGATAILDVVGFNLLPLSLTLNGSAGNGPTDCTLGAGPGFHCINGQPGTDGNGLCTSDADCNGQFGACAIDANCFFGPPLPVPNGAISACVINAFLTELCGSITLVPPNATFSTSLSARVYVTGNAAQPCPLCTAGTCSGGKNAGQACTAVGSAGTSIDCPPNDSTYLATLTVVLPELGTGTTTITADGAGRFCAGQPNVGAFGQPAARTVNETGTPPLGGGVNLNVDLAGAFCIPATGTFIDAFASFPGPGAFSAAGTVDISNLLPLP